MRKFLTFTQIYLKRSSIWLGAFGLLLSGIYGSLLEIGKTLLTFVDLSFLNCFRVCMHEIMLV